ncbi:hypothetical protein V3N95_03865 [Micrococcaceae bacterium Sec6.3]
MSLAQYEERRPQAGAASIKSFGGDSPSVPAPRAVDLLNGVFVVLVTHMVAGELRYRRRIFLDLRAAERHAARCTERGLHASVVLCRLAPVHELSGGWGA